MNRTQEKEQFLHAYLDGELDAQDAFEMEAYLEDCEQARAEIRFYRTMRQTMKDAPKEMAPSGLESRIRRSLQQQERHVRWSGLWHASVAAAMACAITAVIFFWGRTSRVGSPEPGALQARQSPPALKNEPRTQTPSSFASTSSQKDEQGARDDNGSRQGHKDDPALRMQPVQWPPLPRCPRKRDKILRECKQLWSHVAPSERAEYISRCLRRYGIRYLRERLMRQKRRREASHQKRLREQKQREEARERKLRREARERQLQMTQARKSR